MSHLSDAWFYRIKAAQKDLIKICGGIARVSELTSVSTSHVGRWNQSSVNDLMPINVVIILEGDCGMPLVTAAMAELNGFRVDDPSRATKATSTIMASLSDVAQQAGELLAVGAAAAADGIYTPSELMQMERTASTLSDKVAKHRNDLSAAHENAGLRVVGK